PSAGASSSRRATGWRWPSNESGSRVVQPLVLDKRWFRLPESARSDRLHSAQHLVAPRFLRLTEQDLDVLRRLRPVEEVPLREIAATATQLFGLGSGLHAFGEHSETEAVCESHDRVDQRCITRAGEPPLQEPTVERDHVYGELLERDQ